MKHRRSLPSMIKQQSGLAAMEFTLMAPILLTLFFGSVEITRFILINQKVEKLANTVADIVAQTSEPTTTELDTIMLAAEQVIDPFAFGSNGLVIVSSVTPDSTNSPTVNWQHYGGGSLSATSQVGTTGGSAAMPAGFTLISSENVIIAEVYYTFTPIFSGIILNNTQMYRTAYYKPRLGALDSTPSISN